MAGNNYRHIAILNDTFEKLRREKEILSKKVYEATDDLLINILLEKHKSGAIILDDNELRDLEFKRKRGGR